MRTCDSWNSVDEREKKLPNATSFQKEVYAWVARIPAGKVTTYSEIARVTGCGSCRAIGQALKKNPYAPRVPCHRVIRSDLSVGGFRGKRSGSSVQEKEAMLLSEGVECRDGKVLDPSRIHIFQSS